MVIIIKKESSETFDYSEYYIIKRPKTDGGFNYILDYYTTAPKLFKSRHSAYSFLTKEYEYDECGYEKENIDNFVITKVNVVTEEEQNANFLPEVKKNYENNRKRIVFQIIFNSKKETFFSAIMNKEANTIYQYIKKILPEYEVILDAAENNKNKDYNGLFVILKLPLDKVFFEKLRELKKQHDNTFFSDN